MTHTMTDNEAQIIQHAYLESYMTEKGMKI